MDQNSSSQYPIKSSRRELLLAEKVWQGTAVYLGILVFAGVGIANAYRKYQLGSTGTAILSAVLGLIFILVAVTALISVFRRLWQSRFEEPSKEASSLPISRVWSGALTVVWFLSLAAIAVRVYQRPDNRIYQIVFGLLFAGGVLGPAIITKVYQGLRAQALQEVRTTELASLTETDFEKLDQAKLLREEKERIEFEQNRKDAFLIKSIELSGVDFFGACSWQLQPGVNILLGRNGFGKSLLLRSLAALLQRNEEASKDLFANADDQGFIHLKLARNGNPEEIVRVKHRFSHSVGKIPILAVPDSRFVNRANTVIEAPKEDHMDLAAEGAAHFLGNRPYGEMFDVLFNELCFDYLEERSFDQPVFKLLQGTIETLTDDKFRFQEVKRVSRNKFSLMVLTEGNLKPLPIQYASQGTLSVLGVVGVIRSYLKALFPKAGDEELLKQAAIVFIDELDAHLHPLWQQKLTGILRGNFPNIQFVLSAHSPLVVAGCWNNEVTVLRKAEDGFRLEQLERDFVGTSVAEIYDEIFGVEEYDQSYLQSASRASSGFSNQARISQLERKGNELDELERRELERLMREEAMILRVGAVGADRKDKEDRIMDLEAQVGALKSQLKKSGEAVVDSSATN